MTPDTAELLGTIARWVAFTATLVVLGACGFRAGVRRTLLSAGAEVVLDADRRTARLGLVASGVLLAALGLKLWAQLAGFVEPGEPITGELLQVVLGDTAWGRGWTAQFLAAGLATAGFAVTALRPLLPGWLLALAAVTAVALATPLTGHATASERAGGWGYPLDVIHVLGGGAWLGTLTVMVAAGFAAARRDTERYHAHIRAMVEAFSPIALAGAAMVVVAGGILGLRYLDWSVSALWTSGYGRALAGKVILLAVIAAIGAWNWRVVTPTLGQPEGSRRLARSSAVELTVGLLLLLVTAVLVHLPMPGEE